MSAAYKEGMRAFRLGKMRGDNPYARGTSDHLEWDAGWYDG